MFSPINKETNKKKLKCILKERGVLKDKYYKYLVSMDIDTIYDIQLVYDENIDLYTQIKEYALYNILLYKDIDIYKYDIFKYSNVLLLYIHKTIHKKEFVKARKLLNIAKSKGYVCNKYYELEDMLYKYSHGISKM